MKINDVIKHPNWSMGKKISTDSATMMNKVFEVIEASKIFDMNSSKIEIIVHPKSLIHAIVVFNNGLVKILMHDTSMEIPIFNIIFKNEKIKFYNKTNIKFKNLNGANFIVPNNKKFPYLDILRKYKTNDTYFEVILVTINDELVRLFLDKKISFIKMQKLLIKIINKRVFSKYYNDSPNKIKDIYKMINKIKVFLKENDKLLK